MRTKKKKESGVADKAPEQMPIPIDADASETKQRLNLNFDLDANGKPDFSSMRDKTKEKLRAFMSDPSLADFLGVKSPVPEVQVFHPSMVSGLYDLLGSIESTIATRMGGIPEPVAKKVFRYSDEEKAALAGPTVRVLNKYASAWMIRYQDEIALATLLISLTIAKVNAASLLTKQKPFVVPSPVPEPVAPATETKEEQSAD